MSDVDLDELLEAHLAGGSPTVPKHLESEFRLAVAGCAALVQALGETVATVGVANTERPLPNLPEDYEIVRELGRGGMGVVYLARQKSLHRQLAVKVLRPGEAAFGPMLQRFLEEARHLARLRHPNIVSVHEVGRAGDEPYFTMDYVEGEPLSALMARETLSPTRALAIWKQAAEAVQYAHAQGIIHRDLKPGNILIDESRAYVTDFGLARDMTQSSQITRTGEVMGAPAYMAPEQALGLAHEIGEATDVHALGAVLYEMLTGRPPFGKDAPANVLMRLLREDAPAPRHIDRRIPRDLETICLKALAKQPAQRYATVQAFLEDVRRYEAGTPIQARRPSLGARLLRVAKRNWKIGLAILATATVVMMMSTAVVAPKSQDLLTAGDERHAGGQHADAIALYRQALARSWDTDRVRILERILRCAHELGDGKAAVETGVELVQVDPDAWLGPYEYPVAQAIRERRIAIRSVPFRGGGLSTEALAARRFDAFLWRPYGTASEKAHAARVLSELRQALGQPPFETIGEILPNANPADGSPDALLKSAGDPSRSIQQRTEAAYSAGLIHEQAGNRTRALAAYRQAFEMFRQLHPVYAGTNSGIESLRPHSLQWEAVEPRLLRHLALTIERLDPEAPRPLRGGLRFRIAGLDLSPDVGWKLKLSLWDAAGPEPGQSGAMGEAPIQVDQTAWVGVADGRYRIEVDRGSHSSMGSGQASRQSSTVELDFSRLPKVVEIRGATIDLPSIQARLVEVIDPIEPANHAEIDPHDAVLRWRAFPLAKTYRVTIWRTLHNPFGGIEYKESATVGTPGPEFPLRDLSEGDVQSLQLRTSGGFGAWSVEALDADGHWLARTQTHGHFSIAGKGSEQ